MSVVLNLPLSIAGIITGAIVIAFVQRNSSDFGLLGLLLVGGLVVASSLSIYLMIQRTCSGDPGDHYSPDHIEYTARRTHEADPTDREDHPHHLIER